SGSHAEQTAKVMLAFEKVLLEYRPDIVVVVGEKRLRFAGTSHLLSSRCLADARSAGSGGNVVGGVATPPAPTHLAGAGMDTHAPPPGLSTLGPLSAPTCAVAGMAWC
ncbi:MAG: hypothetical protein D6802_12705, partial [Ardenticatenia bacterium]